MRLLSFCCASILLIAGCSSGPLVRDAPDLTAPAEFPNHSTEQVLARMAAVAAADSLVAFSSQAKVEVRSPSRDADLSATIRQRAADTLWASARGPLSIEVARALVTERDFALHDKINDRLYLGPTRAVAAYFPVSFEADASAELFSTFLGTLHPTGEGWTIGTVDGYYRLTDGGPSSRVYTIDPASWRTVRYQHFVDGQLFDERAFSAFDVIDGRILPRRVEVWNPQSETRLTIEHRKLTLNPTTLDFPFSPGDADVRRLD
ncbi:MAG: DUF4292 domain-containing protein [Rhodothermales bacterium]